jgi:hypothetical protein
MFFMSGSKLLDGIFLYAKSKIYGPIDTYDKPEGH